MDYERLRELRNAVPFTRFDIVLKTGERLPVCRARSIALSPGCESLAVVRETGGVRVLNWTLVVALDVESPKAA